MYFLRCAFAWHRKVLLPRYLLLCVIFTLAKGVQAIRAKRSTLLDDDTSIRTEYIDRNNRTIWAMFNLTEAQMSRIFSDNNANNKDPSVQQRDSQYFDHVKEYRINDIRNRLQSAFHVSNSEEGQEHPLHEMAAYPICGSESNESSWQNDNNVTIHFSNSLFEPKRDNLNLDSAILRLYKINPNGTDDTGSTVVAGVGDSDTQKPKRCAEPLLDSQIRITVSIVQQMRRNKRERKKRICNTIMMNVSKTGWVEIDIKRAIYIWENVERQQQQPAAQARQPLQPQSILVGRLMIEVHDEEERPLKPGLFFKPPKCDQAELAIPWNYYGPHTALSPFAAHEVPRYPRLDVKLIGYAAFAPKNYNRQLHQKLRDSLRRQLYNLSKNSAESETDSTTSITPTAEEDTFAATETEHNNRKRHARHHQYRRHSQEQEEERKINSDEYDVVYRPTTISDRPNGGDSVAATSASASASESSESDAQPHRLHSHNHSHNQRVHQHQRQHKHHHHHHHKQQQPQQQPNEDGANSSQQQADDC